MSLPFTPPLKHTQLLTVNIHTFALIKSSFCLSENPNTCTSFLPLDPTVSLSLSLALQVWLSLSKFDHQPCKIQVSITSHEKHKVFKHKVSKLRHLKLSTTFSSNILVLAYFFINYPNFSSIMLNLAYSCISNNVLVLLF